MHLAILGESCPCGSLREQDSQFSQVSRQPLPLGTAQETGPRKTEARQGTSMRTYI
ncbi:mCG140365 [Mus musculus]|nr:mCG140365 [Mus musculus]